MTSEQVESRLKNLIVEQLGIGENEIHATSAFIEDLGADSLDIVELVMRIEEEFNIEIPDDDAASIKSVKDAIDYINGKLAEA